MGGMLFLTGPVHSGKEVKAPRRKPDGRCIHRSAAGLRRMKTWVGNYFTRSCGAGRKYWADATPVAGQQFEYAFDDIGNRKSSRNGGDQTGDNLRETSYTANRLNQYSSRTTPSSADVTIA